MARRRDYAAEYRRRIERERVAAERENRPVNIARARGHISHTVENRRRKERRRSPDLVRSLRYWESRTRFGISPDEYRIIVDSAVERSDISTVVGILRSKYYSAKDFQRRVDSGMTSDTDSEVANSPAANGSLGQGMYYDFKARYEYLPIELFWYHGYY